MQVSEQKDHITHAVIGGADMIEMRASDDAGFLLLMATTLYKNQELAVVRETLCNAWDAHIEAGCTDKPVEITLTNDSFTIKDYGKGIHRDDMGLIYGVFGNSTKKNDGKQTGGFGLGCKSPFAYTDHFEVVSCHDRVMTLYNLSKSSAQAMGKPGIVPLMSMPTLDTGLKVTIPIKSRDDSNIFRELIKRIVRNGDMNMTLNGELLPRLDFDNTQTMVLITTDDGLIENQTPIMVRYGNVIYPVDPSNEIESLYEDIEEHLKQLGRVHGMRYYDEMTYYIVFQAPPHSIAVQPSREGLSMQEHTIKTLIDLMGGFMQMVREDFPAVCNQIAVEVVDEAIKEKRYNRLLSPEEKLPTTSKASSFVPPRITDLGVMARRYMEANYPRDITFRKKDIAYRLKEMVKAKLLDRGLVQSYLRALDEVQAGSDWRYSSNQWLQRHVIARLAGKLIKAGLSPHSLYVYDPEDANSPRSSYGKTIIPITPANKVCPKHLFNALPYLRNIVVLSTSIRNVYDRCKKHDVFKEMGDSAGFIFYHVGTKKKEKEAAFALFNASNMHVVDLTFKQPWEMVYTRQPDAVPKKKPKKGIAALSSVALDSTKIFLSNFQKDDAARIEAPEFIALVSLRDDHSKTTFGYHWNSGASAVIVDLFGDKGGITNKTDVAEKWIAGGARKIDEYVTDKVCTYMMTSPTIREYWSFRLERVTAEKSVDHSSLFSMIYHNPALRDEYGLINNLTAEDKKYMILWDALISRYEYRHEIRPKNFSETRDYLNKIPLHRANFDLVNKFKGNKLLRVINDSGLSTLITQSKQHPKEAADALALLNLILNN